MMLNGRQIWSATERPLFVPKTARYLQIACSMNSSPSPVSSIVAGRVGDEVLVGEQGSQQASLMSRSLTT